MEINKIKGTAFISYDISGSIDRDKKAYYKKVYDYYQNKYDRVQVISHTTVGKFTNIDSVLGKGEAGGTYISSGLKLAVGEILARNNPLDRVIMCGDGDNWSEDNDRVFNLMEIFNENCKIDYFEFLPSTYSTTMYEKLRKQYKNDGNIKLYRVMNKEQGIFGNKLKEKKKEIDINSSINYNQKEFSKISNEIGKDSTYHKDIQAYGDLAYANGYVSCMKCMLKDDREFLIESFKKSYDKEEDKSKVRAIEYIVRLCNDEFKVVEI